MKNTIVLFSILLTMSLYAGRKTQPERFDNIPVHNALQQLILNPSHDKLVKSDYTKSDREEDNEEFEDYVQDQNELWHLFFNNSDDEYTENDYLSDDEEEQPSATDDFIDGIDEESDSDEEQTIDSDEEQTIDNDAREIVTYSKGPREYTRNMLLHCKRTRGKHYIKGNQ